MALHKSENSFTSISGDVKKQGVYQLPEDYTIKRILKQTGNYPDFDLSDFPSPEIKMLYKLTFQSSTTFTNTTKTRLVNVQDYRRDNVNPFNGEPSNVVVSSGDNNYISGIIIRLYS